MTLFTPAQIAYLRLLFQSRLRSLGAWAAGSYQQGSLVSHAGSVWLATGFPTTGTPGTDPEWVEFGEFTAITELPASAMEAQVLTYSSGAWVAANVPVELPASAMEAQVLTYSSGAWVAANVPVELPSTAATGALLYHPSAGWDNADTLLWDPTTVSGGQLTLDFSTASYRSWNVSMPGIILKQGTAAAGLFLNVEENGTSDGFAGGTYGYRLDMGWGGKGGGNFELYSMNHAERPGEFRIVYGGSGPANATADPPYGHIQFTHYAGNNVWRVKAGLSKEGRFSCGVNSDTYPAPSFPLQVYNEGTSVALAVETTGVIRGVASLATAPTSLSANTFRLWMDSSDSQLKVTLADSTPTESTLVLGLPPTATEGHVLTFTSGAWAAAAVPPALPSGSAGQVLQHTGSAWEAAYAGVPPGMIMPYAGSAAPSGWLVCEGVEVSRTTYAALFDAIGTTYGVGDGSTTFNLPDLRGEFIRGWDGTAGVGAGARGVDPGRTFGTDQADSIKSHQHGMYFRDTTNAGAGSDVSIRRIFGTPPEGVGTILTRANEAAGTETRPRNIALLYCIKT